MIPKSEIEINTKAMSKQKNTLRCLLHRWLLAASALFVLVVAVSCASPIPQDLTSNERLWKDQALKDYDFTLSRQCFCPEDFRGPVDIQVRDGVAASLTYTSDGTMVAGGKFDSADTVDKLFDILKDAYAGRGSFKQKADAINVTYDAQMGYPKDFFIDISRSVADEEQGYTIASLVAR